MRRYLLGFDIGSSSVKVALVDAENGAPVASAFAPEVEMPILAPEPGFAEQHPDTWWAEIKNALLKLRIRHPFEPDDIQAIGISYQMHGLVAVDREGIPLRSSIIWCDSRAVSIGNEAFSTLGESFCLSHYLNSPGNFTASKLKWVKEHEPGLYDRIHRVMLPGDYIAYRLTGQMSTTVSGLSEGIMWDFLKGGLANDLLEIYGIEPSLLPDLVPQFGDQGTLTAAAAEVLGLKAGTLVTYRAGDQPNNAFSLNVLSPGEIAATAGTSGVVYGVTSEATYDPKSRVNAFVHVNNQAADPRYGVLLCVNGTGILNSWLRRHVFSGMDYAEMNRLAMEVSPGADGLSLYPFGNGAERVLENRDPGAWMEGLSFNRHDARHMARAAQEGIVFALQYGMEVMTGMGMTLRTVRAGHANMFLSPLFAQTFADVSGCRLELFDTDGAQGAARGAGYGAGIFPQFSDCFRGMSIRQAYEPGADAETNGQLYLKWKDGLMRRMDMRRTGL
jgi:xylulokinase